MMTTWILTLLCITALVLLPQLATLLGGSRGIVMGLVVVGVLGGGWLVLEGTAPPEEGTPSDWSEVTSVTATTCAKCHPDHYESWYRTYHRTMTREATPEYVKGDFNDVRYDYHGLTTTFTREGDEFFMETVDPTWALLAAQAPEGDELPPPHYRKFRVDRLVGSHWIQECLHRDSSGRYIRLPVLYHIGEQRWIHTHGAFLAPESTDFWALSRATTWNETCLYCHNTRPSKNPRIAPNGQVIGYRTTTTELGISCETCHGPGGDHIALNQNPARRLSLQQSGEADPSIVQPERLSVIRRDEICARCHGALVPKGSMWNRRTHEDPFIAGQSLTRYNSFFWSEGEQAVLAGIRPRPEEPLRPEPTDGRFWGDGTPLTTALEYNGMALSACYENGHGDMSCLSCHAMHTDDPNFLLKPRMRTNEACYQCHESYRVDLTAHTHHPANSSGSLCFNCHMPHQVYSLMTTHRSHHIENPDLRGSLDTGKPNACNLCHLDKSLGWTQEQLARWSDRASHSPRELTEDEKTISAALLMMAKDDARTRVVVAGAFSNPDAWEASGTDWFGPFLTRLMEEERYPAVRYLAHRGLARALGADVAEPYDYLALPATRKRQLDQLRERFDERPITRPMPYLPLGESGLPDAEVLRRLLKTRHDPDLTINE